MNLFAILLVALLATTSSLGGQNVKAQAKRCQEMLPLYKQAVKKSIEDYVHKAINKKAKVTLVDGLCKDWNTVDIMAFAKHGKTEYALAGQAKVVGALTSNPENWKVTGLGHAKVK